MASQQELQPWQARSYARHAESRVRSRRQARIARRLVFAGLVVVGIGVFVWGLLTPTAPSTVVVVVAGWVLFALACNAVEKSLARRRRA